MTEPRKTPETAWFIKRNRTADGEPQVQIGGSIRYLLAQRFRAAVNSMKSTDNALPFFTRQGSQVQSLYRPPSPQTLENKRFSRYIDPHKNDQNEVRTARHTALFSKSGRATVLRTLPPQ
jgi:hypothetical protein